MHNRFQVSPTEKHTLFLQMIDGLILVAVLLLALFQGQMIHGQESEEAEESSTARKYAKRVYHITKIEGNAPSIDGVLDEACWRQGKWDGDFRQREPLEAAEASFPTEMKLLYDNDAIYVAIRAYVDDVPNRDRQIARRDSFAGDMVGIAFDSYFDQRTAFEFDVTGGGSKLDMLIEPDGFDMNWNAVWDVAVGEENEAWISEFRIPFSQLRYTKVTGESIWGLHAWRWFRETHEESNWQILPRDNSGLVYEFGELRGLENLKGNRQIEILPYLSGSIKNPVKEKGNPFLNGSETIFDGGLDAKIGITSNLIVDLTVNPDFGQVEADPSNLSLSTFETFYEEQRPFFLEGKSLFEYEVDEDLVFYSRRIGRHPHGDPDTDGFTKIPNGTRILGAAKITGKTEQGLSIGTLLAVAAEEQADIYDNGEYFAEIVEPQTQFFVSRIRQELDEGGTTIGGIVSGTFRNLDDDYEFELVDKALTGGIDISHRFFNRTHIITGSFIGSYLTGSTEAIEELQTNSIHNFNRLDADHVEVDSTLEQLKGWGGNIDFEKDNGGKWRYGFEVDWRSPGLELNDVGFLGSADRIQQESDIKYVENDPGEWFKQYRIRLRQKRQFGYDGTRVNDQLNLSGSFNTNSNWNIAPRIDYNSEVWSTSLLRGGPTLRRDGYLSTSLRISSDGGKDFSFWTNVTRSHALKGDSSFQGIYPGFQFKTKSRFRMNFNFGYGAQDSDVKWFGLEEYDNGSDPSYFVARIDRKTVSSTLRFDFNFSPEMSLTYYGNLYMTAGTYGDYKLVTDSLADRFEDRFRKFGDREWQRIAGGNIEFTDQNRSYIVEDRDFNYRSFRSNLVFRWEYKPGSTLYVVWSHDRENDFLERNSEFSSDMDRLVDSPAANTILVKASYWFSI